MPIIPPVAKPLEVTGEELGMGVGDAGVEETGLVGVRLLVELFREVVLALVLAPVLTLVLVPAPALALVLVVSASSLLLAAM